MRDMAPVEEALTSARIAAMAPALNELLTELKLDAKSLPTSERRVNDRARDEGWPARRRAARGGGVEYPVATLPSYLRKVILAHAARQSGSARDVVPAAPAPAPAAAAPAQVPAVAEPALLADWQRRCRDARAAILQEVDRLAALGGGVNAAIATVITLAERGELGLLQNLIPKANARSGGGDGARTLSRETLFRWRRLRAEHGVNGLAPKESKRAPDVPAWLAPLLQLWRRPQHAGLPACLEELPKLLPEGVAMPSVSTARRWLDKVAPVDRNKGRMGARALLALKAFKRRDTSGLEPLDVAVADGHTFRAKVAHPVHGKPFQPEVMAVMDAATRYVFGWSAGLAESTWVVMDGIRHGVSNLGLFAILYTDNGSGFVNEVTSDELTGFYARLHITHERATPGRAQARGLIERPQASLWRRCAKKLPTYMGRDMDQDARKRIDKLVEKDIKAVGTSPRLISWQDFLAFIAAEVDAYNHRPHRSLPKVRDTATGVLRHMSPAECLQSWRDRGWAPWTVSAEEMEDLFRPYERRRTLRGEVQLPWGRYFHRALEQHHGTHVLVGYDIHDGSKVWVRTPEGRLIAVAERNGNAQPYMPANKVELARRKRAEGRLKIKRRHIQDIEDEARGAGLIIDVEAAQPMTPEEIVVAEAAFARLEARPASEPPPAPPASDGGRPRFEGELHWAQWLSENPDEATLQDRKFLREALRRNAFRLLLEAAGVDLATLQSIAQHVSEDQCAIVS